jgi:hypothetical protein
MHRPLPSLLIMTSCRLKMPVKSPLVNWLPLVGIEDSRSAIARERFLYRFHAKIGVDVLERRQASTARLTQSMITTSKESLWPSGCR